MSLSAAYAMKKRKNMGKSIDADSSESGGRIGADVVDKVMTKRMAHGGMVEAEEADAKPADYDYLDEQSAPESSNSGAADGDELGNAREDEDRADIVGRAMRQRSMKQRNPRPA